MNSKETFNKAYGSVTKEIGNPELWSWIPSGRGFKFYYLKMKRFFTR